MPSCTPSSSTVPITDLIPDVLMVVPQAPNIIIENALRRKAVEFSNRVRNLSCLVRTKSYANVSGYPIELPAGFTPKAVRDVEVCGVCYDAIGKCGDRHARGYTLSDDALWIDFTPAPRDTQFEGICMTVDYVLTMESACDIPREYFDQYANTIVDGALAIIFAMQGQEWTNRSASESREREFRRGISEAREDIVAEKYSNTGIPLRGNTLIL